LRASQKEPARPPPHRWSPVRPRKSFQAAAELV
jgi:hypothetical protein